MVTPVPPWFRGAKPNRATRRSPDTTRRTRSIARVLYPPTFPVDIRHNSKIDRPALGHWAAGQP